MQRSIQRAAIVAFGVLIVLGTPAWSQDTNRKTIIEGVRDSVRHRIQEERERARGPHRSQCMPHPHAVSHTDCKIGPAHR